jgi:hypothetical protein
MFASIIQNAPYSKNAPIAQFNLGLTYERQNRIPEAAKLIKASWTAIRTVPSPMTPCIRSVIFI